MRACSRCHTPYTTQIEFCGLDGAPVVESARDPLIGVTFDRYRVTERLGGGGMAAVYRAVHQVIDREVAIKVLFGELACDRAFAERFRREAQAASRIKHPGVVEILDFGATNEGMSFLVMEFLKGETLSDAIQRSGPFAPRRAAAVLRQVAAGLGAAHASGFVHRDLKPGNIMLVDAGTKDAPNEIAKILDFGLVQARSSGKDDEESRLTRTGQTLGTPFYMAPEQFQGEEATTRSDLYSLGTVLHEMLSGSSPFRGSLGEVVVQHASSKPPPLAPAGGLEKLAKKLMEKSPSKRPENAEAVVAAIDALALGPVRAEDIPPRAKTVELSLHEVVVVERPDTPTPDADTVASGSHRPIARPPDDVPRSDVSVVPVVDERAAPAPVGAVAFVVVLAVVVAALGVFGFVPLPEALTGSVTVDVDAPSARPVVDVAALVAEVESALARRGFSRADVAEIEALAPLLARFDAARAAAATDAQGSSDALVVVVGELVPEIARARVDARLVTNKLARLAALAKVATASLDGKRRSTLAARIQELEEANTHELSEAERSRLVIRVFALEGELSSTTATQAP